MVGECGGKERGGKEGQGWVYVICVSGKFNNHLKGRPNCWGVLISGWGEGVACKEIEVLQPPDNLRYLGESDTRQRCTSQGEQHEELTISRRCSEVTRSDNLGTGLLKGRNGATPDGGLPEGATFFVSAAIFKSLSVISKMRNIDPNKDDLLATVNSAHALSERPLMETSREKMSFVFISSSYRLLLAVDSGSNDAVVKGTFALASSDLSTFFNLASSLAPPTLTSDEPPSSFTKCTNESRPDGVADNELGSTAEALHCGSLPQLKGVARGTPRELRIASSFMLCSVRS
eukprot:scaffold2856_cov189-Alexandrium_tamarense.AAC.27